MKKQESQNKRAGFWIIMICIVFLMAREAITFYPLKLGDVIQKDTLLQEVTEIKIIQNKWIENMKKLSTINTKTEITITDKEKIKDIIEHISEYKAQKDSYLFKNGYSSGSNTTDYLIKFNYADREIKTLGRRHLSWAKSTNDKSEVTYKLKQEFDGSYFESYFYIPSK